MTQRLIHWKLTTQQADFILGLLAKQPYIEVNTLVNLLLQQANEPEPSSQHVPESVPEPPNPPLTPVPSAA